MKKLTLDKWWKIGIYYFGWFMIIVYILAFILGILAGIFLK